MTVRFLDSAWDDVLQIYNYIALDKPDAAARTIEGILEAADRLALHPHLGREGQRQPGTRELIHPPYLIVYRIRSETVEILSVIHGSRKH
ncbi:MAG: type II toxin-antitoxin system RelE/ParE family toxin [Bryobacteraceae bacterium]